MKSRGFTFVELLVVVTIIAVLSAVGLVSYQTTNRNARDAKRKADIEQIRSALEICRSETGAYPAADIIAANEVSCGGQIYLKPVPDDPRLGQAGYGYTYSQLTDTTYNLCALLMERADETSPYCQIQP